MDPPPEAKRSVSRRGNLFHIVVQARILWLPAGCVHLLFPMLNSQCLPSLLCQCLPSSTHPRCIHMQHKQHRSMRHFLSIHSTLGIETHTYTHTHTTPGTRISDQAAALRAKSPRRSQAGKQGSPVATQRNELSKGWGKRVRRKG